MLVPGWMSPYLRGAQALRAFAQPVSIPVSDTFSSVTLIAVFPLTSWPLRGLTVRWRGAPGSARTWALRALVRCVARPPGAGVAALLGAPAGCLRCWPGLPCGARRLRRPLRATHRWLLVSPWASDWVVGASRRGVGPQDQRLVFRCVALLGGAAQVLARLPPGRFLPVRLFVVCSLASLLRSGASQ